MNRRMKVLKVEPYQLPEVKEIDPGLASLQHEVDGWIEATYPFEDPVAIICNEEGKLNGMDYNRAIRDENGEVQEIIAGPFRLFAQPEVFLQTQSSLLILPYAMDEFSSRDDGDLER